MLLIFKKMYCVHVWVLIHYVCIHIPHSPPSELITSTANRTENLLQILPASECSGTLSGEWLGQRALSYEISYENFWSQSFLKYFLFIFIFLLRSHYYFPFEEIGHIDLL